MSIPPDELVASVHAESWVRARVLETGADIPFLGTYLVNGSTWTGLFSDNSSCFVSLFVSFHCFYFPPLSTFIYPSIPSFSIAHIPYVLVGAGTASFSAAKAIREKDPQVMRTNMQKM